MMPSRVEAGWVSTGVETRCQRRDSAVADGSFADLPVQMANFPRIATRQGSFEFRCHGQGSLTALRLIRCRDLVATS
jgi:hypothetical protein